MPLQHIANQILTLADRHASTPVLVTPPYLSFRKNFFVELSRELATHTDRDLRIEWYRNLPGVRTIFSDQFAAWHVKSVNRLLRRMHPTQTQPPHELAPRSILKQALAAFESRVTLPAASSKPMPAATRSCTLQITAAITRPGGKNRDLVVGISDIHQKLPDWATAIWLGTSEEEVKRWQAA